MPQIVPYLLGGLTVFLATDVVSLPSPTELAGALRASVSVPAPALAGTPASSINRQAKSDRGAPARATPTTANHWLCRVADSAVIVTAANCSALIR
jgi:hypothetical protein